MDVSVIICTYNRNERLQQTLAAMASLRVPKDLTCELLIVDNASTDQTKQLIESADLPQITLRYLHEPRQGQSYARNTGVAAAQGAAILFTDDDVRPASDWIAEMSLPLLTGQADALIGGVRIADALQRSWMLPIHKGLLASTECWTPGMATAMVGANMAFSRRVLDKVPGFDPELGPGTPFGGGDDVLFSYQVRAAGYRVMPKLNVVVAHHFNPARLSRRSFAERMRNYGRELAYLTYHWRHERIAFPHICLLKKCARLGLWRLRNRRAWRESEGMAEEEMMTLMGIALYRQTLIERQRPRNYDKCGFVKLPHAN